MTSEPPHASSWAAPPEFYLDENVVTRSVRKLLVDLAYAVHTPGELFGTREAAAGMPDTAWLSRVSGTGWLVINRDLKITRRPHELAAYRKAAVHMFLLPGEATAAQLRQLMADNLPTICTRGTERVPRLWRIHASGVHRL